MNNFLLHRLLDAPRKPDTTFEVHFFMLFPPGDHLRLLRLKSGQNAGAGALNLHLVQLTFLCGISGSDICNFLRQRGQIIRPEY